MCKLNNNVFCSVNIAEGGRPRACTTIVDAVLLAAALVELDILCVISIRYVVIQKLSSIGWLTMDLFIMSYAMIMDAI